MLPQRRAPVGSATGQQQRTRGALTEPRREQRRLWQRRHDQFVDVVGVDQQRLQRQLICGLRQAHDDAVVTPHRLDRHGELFRKTPLDGHRPRGMHRRAERAEDAHPPVTDLITKPLDHDRAVVGHGPSGLRLFLQVHHHVPRSKGVERVVPHQPVDGGFGRHPANLTMERTQGAPQLQWPPGPIAVPERHLAGLAGSGRHHHTFERDVLNAPRAGTEQERLPRSALVDHFLVELADARAVGQEHAEQAAIGNRATAGDRQPLGPVAGAHRAVDPIPHEARAQFSELFTGVAPRQQIEHVVQQIVAELGKAGAAAHDVADLLHGQLAAGSRCDVGNDLLCQHVERVAHVARVLDLAIDHPPHDDCGLQQVAAMLREQRALAWLTDRVTGTADALQTSADRTWRFDLDDQIDGTHVDAELETRRGDDRAQQATLELVFDDHPLLACQRTVMGADEIDGDVGSAAGAGAVGHTGNR